MTGAYPRVLNRGLVWEDSRVGVGAGYWEKVRASGYALPEDRSLDDLTTELVQMIGEPDPQLRDGIAYPALATWIGEGVYDDLLTGFGDGVSEGMFVGLGEDGSDSVLRRSFSALLLAQAVERDDIAHVVHSDAIFRWGDRAASWLVRERDLRGYVLGRGWAHSMAHGADLIGALARSRHFGTLELTVLIDVVADRLLSPTDYRLSHDEPDRLAYAVMAILHRDQTGIAVLEPWIERLVMGVLERPDLPDLPDPAEEDDLGPPPEWPTAAAANTHAFLRALHLQLALGVRGHDNPRDAQLFAKPPDTRADLLLVLIRGLRRCRPQILAP